MAVGDIDTAMVLKVIEPEWKRAPHNNGPRASPDRRGARMGRGARPPHARPLPTRWKNHLDKLLPHPRVLKPVEHHAAMTYDAVPDLYQS